MARQANRLTLRELENETCISAQSIQKYEAGLVRIPSHHLMQICQALAIEVNSLFPELPSGMQKSDEILLLQRGVVKKLMSCSDSSLLERIDSLLSNE